MGSCIEMLRSPFASEKVKLAHFVEGFVWLFVSFVHKVDQTPSIYHHLKIMTIVSPAIFRPCFMVEEENDSLTSCPEL
jgi:hypothetical protein